MKIVNIETLNKIQENAIDNNTETVVLAKLGNQNIYLEIKKSISIDDFLKVVSSVFTPPFAEQNNGVEAYVPSGEIMSFRVALVQAFIANIELPDDVVEAYSLCSNVGVFNALDDTLCNCSMYNDLLAISKSYSEFHRMMYTGISGLEKIYSDLNISGSLESILPELSDKISNIPNVVADNG